MSDMGDPVALLFPLIFFGLLYFLFIRPNMKSIKKHKQMIANLKPNDQVITAAGIHGRIISRDGKNLRLEIAPNVQVEVDSSKIESKIETKELATAAKCQSCGGVINPGDQYCGTCGKPALSNFEPTPPP